MLVRDLMTTEPLCVLPEESVHVVRERMFERRVQSLPVVSARGKLRGLITSSDLGQGERSDARVGDVMTNDVLATPAGMDLKSAAALMVDRRLHHLVIIENNEVVGVMSAFDVLRAVSEGRLVAPEANARS